MKSWCIGSILSSMVFLVTFQAQATEPYVCLNEASPIVLEKSFDVVTAYDKNTYEVYQVLNRVYTRKGKKASKPTDKYENKGGDWQLIQNFTDKIQELTLVRAGDSEDKVTFTCSQ